METELRSECEKGECEKGEKEGPEQRRQTGVQCEKGPEQRQGQEQSRHHGLMLAAVEWSRVAWLPCHRPLVHPPAKQVEEP